jgi:hypothetical protein
MSQLFSPSGLSSMTTVPVKAAVNDTATERKSPASVAGIGVSLTLVPVPVTVRLRGTVAGACPPAPSLPTRGSVFCA